jgi:molybdenum cofactor synthesis domain-containing protein
MSAVDSPVRHVPTACVLVIGDEILSGNFRDENTPWLIDRCRALGLDLRRIVVLPDQVEQIAVEVAACSEAHDWVFTTGGVGPTHDDVTMEGVAAAFGLSMERREELVAILRQKMREQANDEALRMADLPHGSELWWDGEVFFPQVVTRNVVIFPGVPALMRMKFDAVAHRFGGVPMERLRLTTTQPEPLIADCLRRAQRRWPDVHIGSYPRYEQRPWTVIVILESRAAPALAACHAWLTEQLAAHLVEG